MKKLFLKQRFFAVLIEIWLKSLRIYVRFPKYFRPGVLGIWHKDLPTATAAFQNTGFHCMISESDDGAMMSRIALDFGYKVTRGSSTHGAFAIRKLVFPLKNNEFVAMALDGPKGPALCAKPGAMWLANHSNTPLWLFKADYSLKITLNSWDKMQIPIPFSKIVITIDYFKNEENAQKI